MYHFAIEVYRRGRSGPLATLPATVDFEPALEWARLTTARHDAEAEWLLTADPEHGSIEPCWDSTSGPPYIEGVRAIIPRGNAEPARHDIPLSYFGTAVQAASASLILRGELSLGEWFHYRVLAHPRERETPERSTAFCVERAEPPLEIEDRSLDEMLSGAAVPAGYPDLPVFIPRSVLREIAAAARQAGAKERGGILIGHLRRDRTRPELFVEVTVQVPARLAEEELASLTFTPETWSDVDAAIQARGRNEIYLGWHHHHPSGEWCRSLGVADQTDRSRPAAAFLSPEDIALHRTVFPRAWSIALLLSDNRHFALFGWRQGMIRRRGFHIVNDVNKVPPRAAIVEEEGAARHEP